MGFLEALAHFAGISFSILVLWALGIWYAAWSAEKVRRQTFNEYAIELGVTRDDFEESELDYDGQLKFAQWILEKYSSDHFKNRFSDLLGLLEVAVNLLAFVVVLCLFVATIFTMVDDKTWEPVIFLWGYIVFRIVWILLDFVYRFVCRVLTDRNPWEAKEFRTKAETQYNQVLKDKQHQAV